MTKARDLLRLVPGTSSDEPVVPKSPFGVPAKRDRKPRDLNARVPRGDARMSAPNQNAVQRAYDAITLAVPGTKPALDAAEAVLGGGALYGSTIRGLRQAIYDDAYEGAADLQDEDTLTVGINGAAGPVLKGLGAAGRLAGRLAPEWAAKAGSAAKRFLTEARTIEDASRPIYDSVADGPFTVVSRRGVENDMRLAPEAAQTSGMAALHAIAMDPARSPTREIANRASFAARNQPYNFNAPTPSSSLARQAGIGRAYQAAAEEAPGYKHATFERIGEMMPQVVEQAKAQNYDQLAEAAYRQLGGEVGQQFDQLPLRMRYHSGEGEYASPNAMMQDVLGNGNLNVFSGGEPHEFLNRIDPATGLSENEKFRAVHDYMGHVVPGSMFGAPGEEIAYAAHSQTLSPLAQLALLSETRGQNSWVNYSPANADLIGEMNLLKAQERERKHAESWLAKYPEDRFASDARGALEGLPSFEEMRARRRELGQQFNYAPQRAVLLPPEYLDPMSQGGVPDWLRSTLSAKAPTNDVRGVHFSKAPDLSATDPSRYGTGAFSGERAMVRREGLPDRTYFYSGPEGTVVPEESVGRVAKNVYETKLGGLYDLQQDPEGLVKLAKAYNLSNYKPAVPEYLSMMSGVEPRSALPDMERLVRDYGYSGYLTDMGRQRAAASYLPVSGLRRLEKAGAGYADGGAVA